MWPDLFIGCSVPSVGFCLLWQAEAHLEISSVRVEWGQGTLWPWFMGISMRSPPPSQWAGKGEEVASCPGQPWSQGQVSPAEFPRALPSPRGISLGGRLAGPLGTGASGLPGREAEDTPSRHVPGRTGIQFPVLPTGDKGGDLRPCSSCARSSAGHFWGLEPGASIYWPRLGPVGEVRQGGQVTGSQTAPSVSLPSCPLHSSVSCFHAVFGTGPSLACPEPGYPCLGH